MKKRKLLFRIGLTIVSIIILAFNLVSCSCDSSLLQILTTTITQTNTIAKQSQLSDTITSDINNTTQQIIEEQALDKKSSSSIINKLSNNLVIDNGDGTYTYKNKWLVSYETLLFNTLDGDIDIGQYALDGNGTGYYIRTKPKSESQFEWVDLSFDYKGLKSVKIIAGHAYYDEFLMAQGADYLWDETSQYYMVDPSQLPSGSVLRVRSDATKYNTLKTIPDASQPTKTETVTKIPKIEPVTPKSTHNSVGFDATSNSGKLGAVSSYAWNHTCGATANLLVFGDSNMANVYRVPTGVTYDGSALTFVRSDTDGVEYDNTSIFFMYAPATGSAKSVSVTYAAGIYRGVGGVVSYSGAKQSGQPDAHNGADANSGSPTVNVTTVADNSWVFSVVQGTNALTCGNTQRWNVPELFTSYPGGGSDTDAPKTPAGSQTMSWTQSSSGVWVISAVSFAPEPPPVAPSITISAATLITSTTARLNGNITATGGEAPTVTVYWGDDDAGQVAVNWDFSSAPTSPAQPQGVAAFYKDIGSLTYSTTYYFSAAATNSGGTTWVVATLTFKGASVLFKIQGIEVTDIVIIR